MLDQSIHLNKVFPARKNGRVKLRRFYEFEFSINGLMDDALLAVNHIIEYYRTKSENYWVEKMNELEVYFFSFEIRNGEDKFLKCVMTSYKNKAITIANTIKKDYVKSNVDYIQSRLSTSIWLWEVLYADAKTMYDLGKYREGIISDRPIFHW